MANKKMLWCLGLLAAVPFLFACSVSKNRQNPASGNAVIQNKQNSTGAGEGTTVQTMVSWAYSYPSIGNLSKAADLIVKGKVTGIAQSYVDKGIPFTDFNVAIEPPLKGTANSTIILVHQTGGTETSPAFEISDDPLLVQGKTCFLFMRKGSSGVNVILGGPQGRFEVLDNQVYSLSRLYKDRHISDLGVNGTSIANFTQQIIESFE